MGCGYTICTSAHTATRNSRHSVILVKQYGSSKNLYANRSRRDWWKVNLMVSNRRWKVQRISTAQGAQTKTPSGEVLFKYLHYKQTLGSQRGQETKGIFVLQWIIQECCYILKKGAVFFSETFVNSVTSPKTVKWRAAAINVSISRKCWVETGWYL
jgi:hypothetical protein